MRLLMPLLRLVLVVLAVLVLQAAPAGAQTASISGVVTRASDGAPLAGLRVYLYSPAVSLLTWADTAVDGSYSFPSRHAGVYLLAAGPDTVDGIAYLGMAYSGAVCDATCPTASFTPVAVSTGQAVTGVNFSVVAAGQLSGTVTGSATGAVLPNIRVDLHTATGFRSFTNTNASGAYSFTSLVPGTYYVKTTNNSAYIDEVYSSQACELSCDPLTGNPIVIAAGASVGNINFSLDLNGAGPSNGVISGTVRSADTNAAISSAQVQVFSSTGASVGTPFTGSDGSFVLSLPPGTYFARTALSSSAAYRNRLFNGINCSVSCSPTSGTPIVVTSDQLSLVNFLLPPAGGISGTVTLAANGSPASSITIEAYPVNNSTQVSRTTSTAGNGTYSLTLLPGHYFIKARGSGNGYGDELYDDVQCLGSCAVTGGSGVAVADSGFTTGIDFALTSGGNVAGTITAYPSGLPMTSVDVALYTPTGQLVKSTFASSGSYVMSAPVGTYFVVASKSGYSTRLFNDLACSQPCNVTAGTPLIVTAGSTATADFQMRPVGTLTGFVRDATTLAPVSPGVSIEVYSAAGALVTTTTSNPSTGEYSVQLHEGTYRVRTRLSSLATYLNELFNELPCGFSCSVQAGAGVSITGGTTTSGVDFTLAASGGISGTVTNAVDGQGAGSVPINVYGQDGTLVASTTSTGSFLIRLPPGTYFVTANPAASGSSLQPNFAPMLYANQSCLPACLPETGTPVVVTGSAVTPNINFVLPAGGMVAGRVTDAGTAQPIGSLKVGLYTSNGVLVTTTLTSATGHYAFARLAAGTFFVRTLASGAYVDEIYNGQTLCFLQCSVTSGTPVAVTAGQVTSDIDFALAASGELLQNGSFANGTSGWSLFATPTTSHLVSDVQNETLRFTRVPAPIGTSNQALVFQPTGVALPSGTPLLAQFYLGSVVTSSSSTRKRVSVLVHDADFSDLAVCTFWLPAANMPGTRFGIRLVTTKAWTNATISFYAATATAVDERVTLDNVSLQALPGGTVERTECLTSDGVRVPGGADSADLLVNGDFSSGSVTPGWGLFGQIQGQVTGGVFEFIKLAGTPAGVVLQQTGQSVDAGGILTATFDLGNSSGVRKRATVILHDNNFSDLAACTFWLDPGQALGTFTMRMTTTKAWTNGTISIYPATSGVDQWIRLDNVTLKRTPSAVTTGTTCLEPAGTGGDASGAAAGAVSDVAQAAPASERSTTEGTASSAGTPRLSASLPGLSSSAGEGANAGADEHDGDWISDGFIGDDTITPPSVWLAVASEHGTRTLTRKAALADDQATTLRLRSWLTNERGSRALVQVSSDGLHWETIREVAASDTWMPVEIDLAAYRGTTTFLRLCFEAVPADAGETDSWRVEVGVD